jgi:selenocysteine lyase/cysteine desulfurase
VSAPDFGAPRRRFPLLDERTYFATHSLGPISNETLADLDEYRRTIPLRNRAIEAWMARIDEIRRLFARLIHADDDEIALGPNATACQAALAAALQPRPGRDVIVTTDLDFPSTRYLWHAQARRGFQIRNVTSNDGISVPGADIVRSIDERVAVVAMSLVSYANGALLEAAPVIRAAHAAGAIVVLDAFQAMGIVPTDVHELGVDALVAGTQKWLSSPTSGVAFLYVKRSLAESLEPAYPGWFAHAQMFDYERAFVPAPGARRFEQGAPAVEAIYAARAGVQFAIEVGVPAIRERNIELTERLIAGADALGIPLHTPRPASARGGTICLGVSDPSQVAHKLRDLAIDVDTRPRTGIRLSAHPCNNESDCDRVLDQLARMR